MRNNLSAKLQSTNCSGQEELGGEVPHVLQCSRKPIIILHGEALRTCPQGSAPQGSPLASTRLGGGTQVGSKFSETYVALGSLDSPTVFCQSTSLQQLKNKTKETKSVLHTQSLRTPATEASSYSRQREEHGREMTMPGAEMSTAREPSRSWLRADSGGGKHMEEGQQ